MRAFVVQRYGGPEVVQPADMPDPKVGPGDLLLEVRAASVNPIDWKVRSGKAKPILPYRTPFVLGHDCSGVVRQVGPGVEAFAVGDEVYARPDDLRIGTFAERAVVPATSAAHKPKTLSHAQAAALPLVGLTAWQCLFDAGGLKAGQKVLVHGGSGGVGAVAVQLANHAGAHVIATASAKNQDKLRALGAHQTIDYGAERFEDRVKDLDLVVDTVGEDTLARSFGVLRPGGMVVSISGPPDAAFARQKRVKLPVRWAITLMARGTQRAAAKKGVSYQYLWMNPSGEQLAQLARLADEGKLQANVDRTFSFDQTPQAIAFAESGKARGKVVIELPPGA